MRQYLFSTLICTVFFTCTLLAFNAQAASSISSGMVFPETAMPSPFEPEQRSYLGLNDEQPFTLNQISGRVVLLEILNVHCPHCQKQTQPYNKLYRMIEADPETKGKIKLIGVAVGNSDEAIDDFVVIYSVAFPVVSDRNFKMHRALRAGQTPFAVYALRDNNKDKFVVTDTHLGVDHEIDELFAYLKDLLSMKSSDFTSLPQDPVAEVEKLLPPQTEETVDAMVSQAFNSLGSGMNKFRRLNLSSDRWVYAASVNRNGHKETLFAEVGNRSAICDVCHSVHFFYIFDRNGKVLNFTPLHLTKYGNVDWNQEEIDFFTKRVVGKNIVDFQTFHPDVDAVTSATMTSAIIFNDITRGVELMEELRQEKLIKSQPAKNN